MMPPRPWPKGPRLTFRPLEEADASGPYATWINDARVKRYLVAQFGWQSPADIARYIEANNADARTIMFAVCAGEGGPHVGNIKFLGIDPFHRHTSISIVIGDVAAWGTGIGTEAIALSSRYAFEVLGLYRIDAGCFAENRASARIFEKCGYIREGVSRGSFRTPTGRDDAVHLGLLVTDPPLWRTLLGVE